MAIRPLNVTMTLLLLAFLTPFGELAAQDQQGVAEAKVGFAQPLIDVESFGLLRGDGSNAFVVFSKQRKRWSTSHFRKHLRVQPVTLGEFGPNASNAIIGFSGITGTWDSLRVPNVPEVKWKEDGSGVPSDAQKDGFDTESIDGILVKTSRGTMKFAAGVGVWQLADDAASASP